MLVLLAASSHPQSTGPEFPKPPKVNMTADRQRALGLEAAAEVYKQMPVLPDRSPQTQYLNFTAKMYTTLGLQKRLVDRFQDEFLILG
jgi:hypothetical protein